MNRNIFSIEKNIGAERHIFKKKKKSWYFEHITLISFWLFYSKTDKIYRYLNLMREIPSNI